MPDEMKNYEEEGPMPEAPKPMKTQVAKTAADYVRPMKEKEASAPEPPKAIRSTPKPILEDGGKDLAKTVVGKAASAFRDAAGPAPRALGVIARQAYDRINRR